MYQGFVAAAEEEVPQAHIVVDRFHVARAYHDCADAVRKHELKRLKQTLSKERVLADSGGDVAVSANRQKTSTKRSRPC